MPVSRMNTEYNIKVSIRTLQDMLEIGAFYLGSDADFANNVFDGLQGDVTPGAAAALIRIDLERKERDVLPVRLKSICCTLNQCAENCKIITRDVFRFFALEK